MAGTLRVWVNGAWEDVGGAAAPVIPEEVVAGTAAPTDAATDLWVDTTDPLNPVLKVKDADGNWKPVGGGAVPDEVHIGDTDPYVADPAGSWDVWIAVAPPPRAMYSCPTGLPPYAGSAYDKVLRMEGLAPGKSYLATVVNGALNVAARTADANGQAEWTCYSSTVGNLIEVSVHDGALATDPVLHVETFGPLVIAPVPSASPGPYSVGAPLTFTVSGLPPNWPVTLVPFGLTNPTITEPLDRTTDAAGTVAWTATPTSTGTNSFDVWIGDEPGSPCPPRTMSQYKVNYSVTVT